MTDVVVVAGTRPEAIKLSTVLRELGRRSVDTVFAWTGQHYDYEMSRIFFDQLGMPNPIATLELRDQSQARQTANVIVGVEGLIRRFRPRLLIAEGDTNSVLGAAIAAAKSNVRFAHVEAGLRSYDMSMPEEINRVAVDHLSELLFAPTALSSINLTHEGIPERDIYLTGNTVLDVAIEQRPRYLKVGHRILSELGLSKGNYLLVTLHRQENTDDRERLRAIVRALLKLSRRFPVVFPVHPRTKKALARIKATRILSRQILIREPLGYLEFMGLLAYSRTVVTDSGGVQEEATVTETPTVTLRYSTERPETVACGLNILAGAATDRIVSNTLRQASKTERPAIRTNPFGDGRSGTRIGRIISRALEDKPHTLDFRKDPYVTYALSGKGRERPHIAYLSSYDTDGLALSTKDTKRRRYRVVRGPISSLRRL